MSDNQLSNGESVSESKVMNLGGGTNQARVRDYNERLVLSLIQREEALSRAEIARRSGLSAQTVTIISRELEADALLQSGLPVRGKVGQPSIPLALNPNGAFSLGLKIGRRSAELALIDFTGEIRMQRQQTYDYPMPARVLDFVRDAVPGLIAVLEVRYHARLAGIGIAMPFELWSWTEHVGPGGEALAAWREADMVREVAALTGLPAFLQNDATAACEAELALSKGREFADFIYFFVGFFIGGGVVLNHQLYPGQAGYAGALAPMPLALEGGKAVTLLDRASIWLLEAAMQRAGRDPSPLWLAEDGWSGIGPLLDDWLATTARHIALAIISACSVIDFEAAIIDGGFPPWVRERLVAAVMAELARLDARGISPIVVQAGRQGANARVVGAARLPLSARYNVNRSVLFKAQERV